jgi:hypothetical protein
MRNDSEGGVYPGGSVKAEGLGDGLLCGEGILPLFFERGDRLIAEQSKAKMASPRKGGTPSPRAGHRQAALNAASRSLKCNEMIKHGQQNVLGDDR